MFLWHRGECLGKADGEDVGVAVAYKGDGCIEHPFLRADEETAHRECHHDDTDDEERAVG